MITILITIVHVIVALILILVVLLQTGKRADLAGAFGGGGSQTAFGTRGAATALQGDHDGRGALHADIARPLPVLLHTGRPDRNGPS